MKKLGIIGGFGPETSSQFQLAIIDRCRAIGATVRPNILMWNAPIPLAMEENLILRNCDLDKFLPFLREGAQILEKAGADILCLPCNTLHVFIDEIRRAVHIPVLSIIDTTIEHLIRQHVTCVAIFGTQASLNNDLIHNRLRTVGITPIIPSTHEQQAINNVIFDILCTKAHRKATRILHAITQECVERGAKDVLLACTDLQIVFPKLTEVGVHDTMHILVDACVREIL